MACSHCEHTERVHIGLIPISVSDCDYPSDFNGLLRVPTSTGKPGTMREVFPVREKSGNFSKKARNFVSQGKVRGN